MNLYNTLTKKIEPLKPINPKEVSVYTCGPTVYDYPHIGNWFTFIRYDLLIRTLIASGYKPKWVMNITDVGHLTSDADEGEDKLEKGAKKESKSAWEIADYYTDYFIKSLSKLNFIIPQQLPRATEHIPQQIELIKILETKGYTYKISDGIYYDTAKFPRYRDFANLDLDDQISGLRVKINPEKKNKADFALWKFSPSEQKRDMEWDSPWGVGFPGWHIECSAMCLNFLGKTIDIHSGGIDHIPIHHTNEIAQSEAITNQPLAHIWLHTNHILIDDQKISKSLGNGITLEDIKKKSLSLDSLRLLVIESHYRSQSKFSWDNLKAAEQRLLRYKNLAVRQYQPLHLGKTPHQLDILSAMQDDLNTPLALKKLEQFISSCEAENISLSSLIEALKQIDLIFGFQLMNVKDIDLQDKETIKQRELARKSRKWNEADRLRDQLATRNITILDLDNGPLWQYLA